MAVKILSQSGTSLADMYDVVGSIAGVEQLESREVQLVHEMGQVLFSERVASLIILLDSTALAQSVTWDVINNVLPDAPWRILGVAVDASAAVRVINCSVQVRIQGTGREFPLWAWDVTPDGSKLWRRSLDGAAAADTQILLPLEPPAAPNFASGALSPSPLDSLSFRGATAGFGAGTVTVRAWVQIGMIESRGLSSRGISIPSW